MGSTLCMQLGEGQESRCEVVGSRCEVEEFTAKARKKFRVQRSGFKVGPQMIAGSNPQSAAKERKKRKTKLKATRG